MDDCTRCTWVYLLKHKSKAQKNFIQFHAMVNTQFSHGIKQVRSDNGLEFTTTGPMFAFFSLNSITHQTSCVDTPQQNGIVECKHRPLLEVARALRFQANLLIKFWGECVLTAAYLINYTPTPKLSRKSPYEMLFSKPPSYSHLRVFGCLCYVHDKNRSKDKFASCSKPCIFIGYLMGKKGYRVYDMESHKVFTSQDVIFYENQFPFLSHNLPKEPNVIIPLPILKSLETSDVVPIQDTITTSVAIDSNLEVLSPSQNSPTQIVIKQTNPLPKRTRHIPSYLDDYVYQLPGVDKLSKPKTNPVSSSNFYRISCHLSYSLFVPSHQVFLVNISMVSEPKSFSQVVKEPKWCEAM